MLAAAISELYPVGSIRFTAIVAFCSGMAAFAYFELSTQTFAAAMARNVDRFAGKLALAAALAYGVLMIAAVVRLYLGFDTWIDFDLSLRNQAFWRLIHGQGFVSTMDGGISNFGIHSAYIYLLIVPVYAIFPFPQTLLVAQAIAVALGGYLLFRCLQGRVGPQIALGCCFAYFICTMVSAAVFHGIHEVTFAPPILVLMYDSFFRKRLVPFLGWTFLLLTVKETMPFVVAGFAMLAVFRRRTVAWYAAPMAMAGTCALINFCLVFPHFRTGMNHSYMGLDFLPASVGTWLGVAPTKTLYFLKLISPFLFFGPATLCSLPAVGEAGINLISMNASHTELNRHYTILIGIAFLVSTAFAIDKLSKKEIAIRIAGSSHCAALVLTQMLIAAQLVISPLWILHLPFVGNPNENVLRHMVNRVPPEATVMASHGFLAALSSRSKVYSFYNTFEKMESSDYLLIDGSFLPKWYPAEVRRTIARLVAVPQSDSAFEPVEVRRPFVLLRKRR